jgi:hypothetical protein
VSELFDNRPLDDDTRIISSEYVKLNDLDACLEQWSWDGIKGKSVILLVSQLEGSSNEEVIAFLADHISLGGDYTISANNPEYIVISYGFKT